MTGAADATRGPLVPRLATPGVRLFLTSAAILFVELLVIRWIPAEVRYVGFFSNFLLMASFLGIGLGLLLGRRGADWSLLGLWGDASTVCAAFRDDSDGSIGIVTLPCPERRFPSLSSARPSAIRLERAVSPPVFSSQKSQAPTFEFRFANLAPRLRRAPCGRNLD